MSDTAKRPYNTIECLKCGKVLQSKSRHDFQTCGCDNGTFVDGGNSYMRFSGKDMTLIKVLIPQEFSK